MKKNRKDIPEKSSILPLRIKWLCPLISFIGGCCYAAALPPLNWSFAVCLSLVPLFYFALHLKWYWRMLCGWLWGWGWSIFAYWFLREIHPAVPWMLAPVISLWPALFMLAAGAWGQVAITTKNPVGKSGCMDEKPWRIMVYAAGCAALFTIFEWTRYYLFVWNDLSVTVWRYPFLMQIARISGRYGVSFMITMTNAALFSAIFFRRRILAPAVLMIYPLLCVIYGVYRVNTPVEFKEKVVWKCALIQGNLPQQRLASSRAVLDSIRHYCRLSQDACAGQEVDTVIWPECAIPVAMRRRGYAGEYYRQMVFRLNRQMIIGSLDFAQDGSMTNSALLISPEGRFTGKYDKYHRVPYGEYVPLRNWLPESWVKAFDMGRDLTAGIAIEPLPVSDDIRAGTAVCYEGVFSYLSAAFARNNANVLAAVSNDVWYPASSEPEQHLANVVMRCVETGLPMVRCGNNGGSGVVNIFGEFTQYIGTPADHPELLRETAAGVVTVEFEKNPELTWAVRFENLLVYLLAAGVVIGFAALKLNQKR